MNRNTKKEKVIRVYDYFDLFGKKYMLSVDPFGRGRVVLEDKSPHFINGGIVYKSRNEFELLTDLKLEPNWEKKNDAYWNNLSNLSKWFAMRLQGLYLDVSKKKVHHHVMKR